MIFTLTKTYSKRDTRDYRPTAAKTAGDIVMIGALAAIVQQDLAANQLGSAQIAGLLEGRNAAVAGNLGDNIYLDNDGDPVAGDAGSGALTTIVTDGDIWLGTLAKALVATDEQAIFDLNAESFDRPALLNLVHEIKSDNYTVDAQDAGKVIHVDTDAKAITLPATVAGLEVIVVNDGADTEVGVSISPHADDKIMGPDIAGTDNKDQVNTKATAVRGDFMHLVGDGASGWFIKASRGIWAEEA